MPTIKYFRDKIRKNTVKPLRWGDTKKMYWGDTQVKITTSSIEIKREPGKLI